MSTADQVKNDYNRVAKPYNGVVTLPSFVLESQLIKQALGDASGLTVLDLGGGSGLHAREALEAGARRVDIVDLSREMLSEAEAAEKQAGREGRVCCYEANVAQPLDHLPLDAQYDVVMANWVFDHAGDVDTLRGMWANVAGRLRPGGRFLGIRIADADAPAASADKYGICIKDWRPIEGGLAYTCIVHAEPPWEFEGTSMELSYSGSLDLHREAGLTDVEVMPYREAQTVKDDPEFWALWLEKPVFAVVRGTKVQS